MVSDLPAEIAQDLSWLLNGLVERVPKTRSALLLSSDGLVRAQHGLDDAAAADHLAALASGPHSLARSAGKRFDDGGDVRQIVTELSRSVLFVSTAGHGAELAVLGYEMGMLAKRHLATPDRQSLG